METLLYILGAIGLTHIVVDSTIFEPVRQWLEKPFWPSLSLKNFVPRLIAKISQMISCYQCCGFWCGLVVAWLALPAPTFGLMLCGGFAGNFLANSAAILLNYLEAQTVVRLPDDK